MYSKLNAYNSTLKWPLTETERASGDQQARLRLDASPASAFVHFYIFGTGADSCTRSRRVKCDETKPECERCTWGRRKCSYPSIWRHEMSAPSSKTRSSTRSKSPTNEQSLTSMPQTPASVCQNLSWETLLQPVERRALHHFHHRSALEFSDALSIDFWRCYIPSLSLTSPAIRHAIIAASSLHEEFISSGCSLQNSSFALLQYNKAISAVNTRLVLEQSSPTSVLGETLTACALFVCIEVLLDDYGRALTHLQGGLKLISQLSSEAQRPLSQQPYFSEILELFTRYDSQALNYAGSLESTSCLATVSLERSSTDWPSLIRSDLTAGRTSEAIQKAATSLRHIVRNAQHYMRSYAKHYKYEICQPLHITEARDFHLSLIENWYSEVYPMVNSFPSIQQEGALLSALASLRMSYHSIRINLLTCLEPCETAYDEYTSDFEAIIYAAEEIICCRKTKHKFTIESIMIEHVYYTAMKCRDHLLRNRTIAFLRDCEREGVWDGQALAAVAKTAMEIEENWTTEMLVAGLLCVSESDLDSSKDTGTRKLFIPEECRIRSLTFNWDKKERTLNIFEIERSYFVDGQWATTSRVVKY